MANQVVDARGAALMIFAGMATLGFSDNLVATITADGSLWQFHFLRGGMAALIFCAVGLLGFGRFGFGRCHEVCHARHEALSITGDLSWDCARHCVDQLLDPDLVLLGKVTQDIAVHQILIAGMADAQADPPVVLADMSIDRAQSIVTARAAALFDPQLAGGQVDLVVQHVE